MPLHLEMFNHVEAATLLCDAVSVASDMSSTDDRDPLSHDIARDLGVTPLVSGLYVNAGVDYLQSVHVLCLCVMWLFDGCVLTHCFMCPAWVCGCN